MHFFIGVEKIIRTKDVVGIFDLDTATISPVTRNYLTVAQKNGCVESVNYELPKSFVVTRTKEKSTVYLSPLSASVLKKRAKAGTKSFQEEKNSATLRKVRDDK